MKTPDGREIVSLIELRGLYDGWSVGVLEDGTYYNRWDKERYPARHRVTEEYIAGWE